MSTPTKGNYKESDPVKPFNNYGFSKLGGECAVQMYKILYIKSYYDRKTFYSQKRLYQFIL